jgi:hypothetical protein
LLQAVGAKLKLYTLFRFETFALWKKRHCCYTAAKNEVYDFRPPFIAGIKRIAFWGGRRICLVDWGGMQKSELSETAGNPT